MPRFLFPGIVSARETNQKRTVLHPDLHARLCRARAALRDLEANPRTVAAVAREMGFSPFHFIRLYKAVFGATPHQHQSAAQVDRAKELLLLTDRSITDICMEVGFSSLGSFSTLFKKRVGVSPTGFQRRHRRDGRPRATMPQELTPGCLTLMGGLPATSAISKKPARRASARVASLHA